MGKWGGAGGVGVLGGAGETGGGETIITIHYMKIFILTKKHILFLMRKQNIKGLERWLSS